MHPEASKQGQTEVQILEKKRKRRREERGGRRPRATKKETELEEGEERQTERGGQAGLGHNPMSSLYRRN